MPTFTMTKNYDDGSALTEAMLDAMKSSTETFLNTTKLDGDNIQDGGISTAKLDADAQAQFVPIGTVLEFSGTAAPSGYLMCYGQEVSQATYADLFAVVGTTYDQMWGAAAPSAGNFRIPDCRGATTFGKDDMGGSAANRITNAVSGITGTTLGSTGGAQSVTLAETNLPAHTHTIDHNHASATTSSDGAHTHSTTHDQWMNDSGNNNKQVTDSAGSEYRDNAADTTTSNGAHTHTLDLPNFTGSSGSIGSGTAVNKMPPAVIMNKIIKY